MKNPKFAAALLVKVLDWLKHSKHDMGDHLNAVANAARGMEVSADLPPVVCLCGSTRFKEEFEKANSDLTLAGFIVLSVGHFSQATPDQRAAGLFADITPEQKVMLDDLHKRKIDLADAVVILNKNWYTGHSTNSEIDYAHKTGKPVFWLEPAAGEERTGLEYLLTTVGNDLEALKAPH